MNKKSRVLVLFILIICIIFAVFFQFNKPSGTEAVIIIDGKEAMHVPLEDEYTFSAENLENVVFQVKDGKIAFIHSDCPDKLCVNTGFISKPGQYAACLPNKVLLKITGDSADGVDTVVR